MRSSVDTEFGGHTHAGRSRIFQSAVRPHPVATGRPVICGETCVCNLAAALDEPDYKISRHLGILRSSGLVEARREGAWMYYRLMQGRTALETCLHECFRDCLNEHPTVGEDLRRLESARFDKGVKCDER